MRSVGVKGLYSGLQASILGTAVSQGVYFYLCVLLFNNPLLLQFLLNIVCSSTADESG